MVDDERRKRIDQALADEICDFDAQRADFRKAIEAMDRVFGREPNPHPAEQEG